MNVVDLLRVTGLTLCGPKRWRSEIDDDRAGIYIITATEQLSDCPLCDERIADL